MSTGWEISVFKISMGFTGKNRGEDKSFAIFALTPPYALEFVYLSESVTQAAVYNIICIFYVFCFYSVSVYYSYYNK